MKMPRSSKEEVFYRRWLKKLFRSFGFFTLEKVLEIIDTKQPLQEQIVEYFYERVDFKPVRTVFESLAKKNYEFFEKKIEQAIKYQVKSKYITPNFSQLFPQTKILQKIPEKGIDFFNTQKSIIHSDMTKVFENRKNQLDSFRSSFLFSTEEKIEVFIEKYPETKYAFTDSMGRTEINNLNRDLSAQMATNTGLGEFIWRTAGDERVRESHRALDGKTFSYDKMPLEYNDYNCRCVQEPVIDYLKDLY
jgi:SPP1 gp7 family putative phage head morphogenesis protein